MRRVIVLSLSVFVFVRGYLIHFFVIILCFCCLKQLSDYEIKNSTENECTKVQTLDELHKCTISGKFIGC